jgi:hypothetical protein
MQIKLTFIRQWGGSDRIVWIDIDKLDKAWRRDRTYYLSRGIPNRTAAWITRLNFRRIPMPHLGVDDKGIVSFTDGRHRFAWFRDQGALAIPLLPGLAAAVAFGVAAALLITAVRSLG